MVSKAIQSGYAGFFTAGFTIAAWAPLIPFVKEHLHLEPIYLGAMLLALGLGSVLGMPLAGRLSAKMGSKFAIASSGIGSCVCLILLSAMPGYIAEFIFLFLYGVILGCLEVSVNIYGSSLEKTEGKRLMSGFHAFYSIGEVFAAALMSGAFFFGFSPFITTSCWMLLLMVVLAFYIPSIVNSSELSKQEGSFKWPKGVVWKLAILIAVIFLAEGGMLDWSAIFLRVECNTPLNQAGFGYTLFVIAMAIARLLGDRLATKFGAANVIWVGAALMVASLVTMVTFPYTEVGYASLFVMGLGIANIAPLVISAAARQNDMPTLTAITSATTIGYAGLTLGPVVIGGISQVTSISFSFLCVAAMICLVSIWTRDIKKIL